MVILNETKIKYEHLDSLLESKLIDIRFGNDVNVIIDLKEVFRKFFRPAILPEGSKTREAIEEISSDVINIIGHYRNYFYKKGKYSTFYFLYSRSECEIMKAKYSDYKKDYYSKYFKGNDSGEVEKVAIIKKVIEVLEKIINHVPNSSFIDTSMFDEYTVAKFLIQQTKPNEINLLLSNDEMMAQLINKNTFMLNMKGIATKMMDASNAVGILSETNSAISTNLLPLLLSISGAERYNLDNVERVGLKKGVAVIEKLLASGKLIDTEYVDFPIRVEALNEKDRVEKMVKDNHEKIKKNYDLISNSDVLYSNSTEMTILFNKPLAVYTWNYFLEMNSKVFINYPLNLEMLLKGETLK
jgi:hypothetical protein